ncbi:chromosome segregation protein ScpA [Pedobacter yulinensis]|uniref:Segregation and condensation protein A n=1 Tax=Pedobacter yulinensis TaxID=2126353 RepID=A0A2T3HNR4_9SPHI|nr:segregation/condensation protein A [Pedobacter yulinensis]PST84069.1 chromosome segregation protein ScpA [Pedobacter yulinensis]
MANDEQGSFEIRLPVFEGPFDLLLFFIEKDELQIHEIEIAKITDDFLNYLHRMTALNVELAGEFILVAATLMRIKSKMLLPRPEHDADGNEVDPQQDLIAKLIAYKQFKEVAEKLRVFEDARMLQFRRGNFEQDLQLMAETAPAAVADELHSLDLYKLLMAYQRVNQKYDFRKVEVKHTVVQYPYTITQQKNVIAQLVEINRSLDFALISKNSENKVHFVYNFLAILEMLQQKLLNIQIGAGFNNFTVSAYEFEA